MDLLKIGKDPECKFEDKTFHFVSVPAVENMIYVFKHIAIIAHVTSAPPLFAPLWGRLPLHILKGAGIDTFQNAWHYNRVSDHSSRFSWLRRAKLCTGQDFPSMGGQMSKVGDKVCPGLGECSANDWNVMKNFKILKHTSQEVYQTWSGLININWRYIWAMGVSIEDEKVTNNIHTSYRLRLEIEIQGNRLYIYSQSSATIKERITKSDPKYIQGDQKCPILTLDCCVTPHFKSWQERHRSKINLEKFSVSSAAEYPLEKGCSAVISNISWSIMSRILG